ncbi:MAG: hypothetical protein EOO10_09685 [Chitinophagaceae bacterium]|nr:MAG: hypothetical protein EOO10_09685 [Chitinophagaceae bacterium]
MIKIITLFAIAATSFSTIEAQTGVQVTAKSTPVKMICAQKLSNDQVFVVVDGFETDFQSIALNPDQIENIEVWIAKKAIKKWGEKAKDGAIIIQTKRGTTFYTVDDFIDTDKNINTSVKQIELNGKLLPDMKKILIDKTVFSTTMISSNMQVDKETCGIIFNDKLVIQTKGTIGAN